jgi:hypothetical protein
VEKQENCREEARQLLPHLEMHYTRGYTRISK